MGAGGKLAKSSGLDARLDVEAVLREPHEVGPVHVVGLVVAVQQHDQRPTGEGRSSEAHGVDRAEPASATSTTRSGDQRATATVSPSSAIGERGPPTVSTQAHPVPASLVSDLVDEVGDREAVDAERWAAIGGAIASGYHRCPGHTSSGCSPSRRRARRRRSGPAPRGRTTAPACAPRRRGRERAARPAPRRRPTSCRPRSPCRRRRPSSSGEIVEGFRQAVDLVVGVGGRQRDAQAGRAGATGRRADGGHEQPWSSSSATDASSAALVADHDGTIGDGWPGRRARRGNAAARTSAALRASARHRAASGGAASAGVGRGGEDERAGGVDEEVDERRGPATKPPSEPSVFDSVPATTTSPVGRA